VKKSLFISIRILLFSILFILIWHRIDSHAQNRGDDNWEEYYAGKLENYKREWEWKIREFKEQYRKNFDKKLFTLKAENPYTTPFNMPIIVPDPSIDYTIRIVKPDPNFSYYMPMIRPEKEFKFKTLKPIPDSSEILDLSKLSLVAPDSLEMILKREQKLDKDREEYKIVLIGWIMRTKSSHDNGSWELFQLLPNPGAT